MEPRLLEVRTAGDLDRTFALMTRDGVDGVFAQGTTITLAHRPHMAALAVKNRLPMMCATAAFVEDGCLISYVARLRDLFGAVPYSSTRSSRARSPLTFPYERITSLSELPHITLQRTGTRIARPGR